MSWNRRCSDRSKRCRRIHRYPSWYPRSFSPWGSPYPRRYRSRQRWRHGPKIDRIQRSQWYRWRSVGTQCWRRRQRFQLVRIKREQTWWSQHSCQRCSKLWHQLIQRARLGRHHLPWCMGAVIQGRSCCSWHRRRLGRSCHHCNHWHHPLRSQQVAAQRAW